MDNNLQQCYISMLFPSDEMPFSTILRQVIHKVADGDPKKFVEMCKKESPQYAPKLPTIRSYLMGRSYPGYEKLIVMARASGLSTAYFCEPTEEHSLQQIPRYYPTLWDAHLEDYIDLVSREIDLFMIRADFLLSPIQMADESDSSQDRRYLDAILERLAIASSLKVRLLALDPSIPFAVPGGPRFSADDLREARETLDLIRNEIKYYEDRGRFEIRVYDDPPMQIAQRFDRYVFYSAAALHKRSRECATILMRTDWPGVADTFIDHFEEMWSRHGHRPPK